MEEMLDNRGRGGGGNSACGSEREVAEETNHVHALNADTTGFMVDYDRCDRDEVRIGVQIRKPRM